MITAHRLFAIRANAELIIEQVERIIELQQVRHNKMSSPYYEVFGKHKEKTNDLLAMDMLIADEETILERLMKL